MLARWRSSAAPPPYRRRRPRRSPDRPATSRPRGPRPAPRRAEEARHVEIVDHHVAEQAAGASRCSSTGGGPGSREMIVTSSTSPTSPSARRLLQAGEIRVEAAVEADHQRRAGLLDDREAGLDARRLDRSTGFSQNTALPARAPRSIRSAWVSVGVQIRMASTSERSTMSSSDATSAPVRGRQRLRGRRMRIGDRHEAGVRDGWRRCGRECGRCGRRPERRS